MSRSVFLTACVGAGALVFACNELRLADPDAASPDAAVPDAGEPDRASPDLDAAQGQEDATIRDAGGNEPSDARAQPVCPLAADSPSPLSYVLTDASVFDSVTGLEWNRVYDKASEVETFVAAKAYCEALRVAGHDDWRAPTLWELLSIVDYGPDQDKFSSTIFPDGVGWLVWTSTATGLKTDDEKWLVAFDDGDYEALSNELDDAGKPNVPLSTECVRRVNPPCTPVAPRFAQNGDVVRDTLTGLEWEPGAGGSPRAPADAVTYCNSLGGAHPERPWRVPTVKELASILAFDHRPDVLDPVFSSAWPRWWTSTQTKYSGAFDARYILNLPEGRIGIDFISIDAPRAVRCVR